MSAEKRIQERAFSPFELPDHGDPQPTSVEARPQVEQPLEYLPLCVARTLVRR